MIKTRDVGCWVRRSGKLSVGTKETLSAISGFCLVGGVEH
jgi:hypothetical protein